MYGLSKYYQITEFAYRITDSDRKRMIGGDLTDGNAKDNCLRSPMKSFLCGSQHEMVVQYVIVEIVQVGGHIKTGQSDKQANHTTNEPTIILIVNEYFHSAFVYSADSTITRCGSSAGGWPASRPVVLELEAKDSSYSHLLPDAPHSTALFHTTPPISTMIIIIAIIQSSMPEMRGTVCIAWRL